MFKPVLMVYVASAYSYKGKGSLKTKKRIEHQRALAVDKCIGKLHDKYPYAFIGPITQSHRTAKHTTTKAGGFDHWRDIDFTFIARCDEMWILKDKEGAWKESVGVQEEIWHAFREIKRIRIIDPDTYKVKKVKKIVIDFNLKLNIVDLK